MVAIGLGKMAFGGLGQNLFNPAMVGRAFLMACFPVAMTTWARPFDLQPLGVDAVSGATPLAAAKFGTGAVPGLWALLVGDVGGSIGETSALAVLLGGAFLLLRRAADWRQPLGVLVGAGAFADAAHALAPDRLIGLPTHLANGALMFGALFIATDPVGCPLTPVGRLVFGLGVGVLVMVIRLFGSYPEGVMFAVLLMNALTPLIERWTRPEPFWRQECTVRRFLSDSWLVLVLGTTFSVALAATETALRPRIEANRQAALTSVRGRARDRSLHRAGGRAEVCALRSRPLRAVADGLGVGLGFTLALATLGAVREVLGSGTLLGIPILSAAFEPWVVMVLPAGAFLTLGAVIGVVNHLRGRAPKGAIG